MLNRLRFRSRSLCVKTTTSSTRRGFMFLELLLAVVVIAILMGWYFQGGGSKEAQDASTAKQSIDRSKATACLASRSALRTVILTNMMQHPGQPVTAESLSKSGVNLNVCPAGGTIAVEPDGTLKCSIHQP